MKRFAMLIVLLALAAGCTPAEIERLFTGGGWGWAEPAYPPAALEGIALESYVHPSGAFELKRPAGWEQFELDGEGVFSTAWVSEEAGVVVHIFTVRFEDAPDYGDVIAYIEGEYKSGFVNYQSYNVIARNYDHTPIIVDIELVGTNGADYIVRQWSASEANALWVLRIVAPAGQEDFLLSLGARILPTLRVHPEIE